MQLLPWILFCLIYLNTLQFPMLRLVSLDMCDAKEGNFDVPEVSNNREHTLLKFTQLLENIIRIHMVCFLFLDWQEKEEVRFLSIVKISRCKSQRCSLGRELAPVHRETLVMFWNGQNFTNTLLKQRLQLPPLFNTLSCFLFIHIVVS